jgi:hypothetical protein
MKLTNLLLIASLSAALASNAEEVPSLGLKVVNNEITLKTTIKNELKGYLDEHPYLIKRVDKSNLMLEHDSQANEINKQINKERAK